MPYMDILDTTTIADMLLLGNLKKAKIGRISAIGCGCTRFLGADALSGYELLEIVLLCRAATSSRSPNPRSRNSARSPRNRSAKYVVF